MVDWPPVCFGPLYFFLSESVLSFSSVHLLLKNASQPSGLWTPHISLLVSRITCCHCRDCVQIFWGEASFQAPPLVFPLWEMVFVGIREDLLLRGGGRLLSHGSQWYCGLLFPPYSICPIVSILKDGPGISQCLLVVLLPFHFWQLLLSWFWDSC